MHREPTGRPGCGDCRLVGDMGMHARPAARARENWCARNRALRAQIEARTAQPVPQVTFTWHSESGGPPSPRAQKPPPPPGGDRRDGHQRGRAGTAGRPRAGSARHRPAAWRETCLDALPWRGGPVTFVALERARVSLEIHYEDPLPAAMQLVRRAGPSPPSRSTRPSGQPLSQRCGMTPSLNEDGQIRSGSTASLTPGQQSG